MQESVTFGYWSIQSPSYGLIIQKGGVFPVLFDCRDLSILKLAGKYHWLPYDTLDRFGFDDLVREINNLSSLDFLFIAKNKKYFNLFPKGYDLLKNFGYDYDPASKRAYSGTPYLRRRLEAAEIMLTCLRAGIDVDQDDVDSLQNQPVFLPAFSIRGGDGNLMNAASCAGLGHWGNTAYMLQYVSSESVGMYTENEYRHLKNLGSIFDKSLKTPSAFIFAGSSYKQIYDQLCDTTPSNRHGKNSFNDFWDVYQKHEIPIHLLSCDNMGAMQLAFMNQPDHIAKIAQATFGQRWNPYDAEIPDADGCVDGNKPLIIAADMNIRRINRVCESAWALGRTEVMIAAFKEQMQSFLFEVLPKDDRVIPLGIDSKIEEAFSKCLCLNSLDMDTTATSIKGAVIHA